MTLSRRLVIRSILGLAFAGSTFLHSANAAAKETFYIVGYVTNPGAYEIDAKGTSVRRAIELAGGFSAGRHITGVEIIRLVDGQKQTFDVSLSDSVIPNDTIRIK